MTSADLILVVYSFQRKAAHMDLRTNLLLPLPSYCYVCPAHFSEYVFFLFPS